MDTLGRGGNTTAGMALPRITDEGDRRAAHHLRRLRRERGLSLSALGVALGVTHQAVHKMESGQIRLATTSLSTCAQLLHVTVDDFFGPIEPEALRLRQGPADTGPLEALLGDFYRIKDEYGRRALLATARALAKKT